MKLLRQSFDEKLKSAEAGDHFTVYSAGVGGWIRIRLGRVEWPYVYSDGNTPVHASYIHTLEKQNGKEYEKR